MGSVTATVRTDTGIAVSVALAAAVTAAKVYRIDPSGFATLIRGGDTMALVAGAGTIFDYEAPLDVAVTYRADQATPAGSDTGTSSPVTPTSGGYSYLKDPGYPSRNFKVPVTTSIAALNYAARAGVFDVIDRTTPVVVTAMRQQASGDIVLHTYTDADRVSMLELLRPGKVLLFQTPPQYAWGSQYIHIGDVDETRVGLASEQARRWRLPVTVVDRPVGLAQAPPGTSWTSVKTNFATWQVLKDSGKRWRNILEGT